MAAATRVTWFRVSYRDEGEALRRRVEQLEEELADARRTIAKYQGATHAPASAEVEWLSGIPKSLVLERELPFEASDAAFVAVAEMWRSRLVGQVSQIATMLTHRGHGVELSLRRGADGKTSTLSLVRSVPHLRVAMAVLTFSFLTGAALLAATCLKGLGMSPAVFVASLPFLLVASFLGARAMVRRGQHAEQTRCLGAFETAADLVSKNAPRARVAAAEVDTRAADGADAPEEQATAGKPRAAERARP